MILSSVEIDGVLEKQRKYFASGATLNVEKRINILKKFKKNVIKHEDEILLALKKDLGKSETEGYMCEVGMLLSELSFLIKNVKRFAREKRVKTPISQFASRSYVKPSPYGTTLIMSPWNYPILLTLEPLADAIAAGNTAIVKPSAYSPASAEIIEKIISETFLPEQVMTVSGGREQNTALLTKKFDLVFFTGSQNVGKEVLRHTAETLTPAVLELGGKSPCIVDESAKIPLAAKRIVFGKFLNCGQTCVAPDYVICKKEIKNELVENMILQIKEQFGEDTFENRDYGKIINRKHFERLCALLAPVNPIYGGRNDESTLKIEPTVIDNVSFSDPVMQEEIFGPILPILTYESMEALVREIESLPRPLACYIFSENKKTIAFLTERLRYGGGCVNDTVIHLATSEMGFGGVGESGMGAYHGKEGFDAFSHKKSIVNKKTWIDLPMRYQPYTEKKRGLIRKFLK